MQPFPGYMQNVIKFARIHYTDTVACGFASPKINMTTWFSAEYYPTSHIDSNVCRIYPIKWPMSISAFFFNLRTCAYQYSVEVGFGDNSLMRLISVHKTKCRPEDGIGVACSTDLARNNYHSITAFNCSLPHFAPYNIRQDLAHVCWRI